MYGAVSQSKEKQRGKQWRFATLPVIALILLAYKVWPIPSAAIAIPESAYLNQPVYSPHSNRSSELYHSKRFRDASLLRYQQALRIPTEVYDFTGKPQEDLTGWEPFLELHEYFKDTYPLVHELDVHLINKLGYIVIWKGSDETLEPLVFTAHQDVVPVDKATEDQWIYPPYSAHYDGQRVWARGSGDTKNLVVALFESWEELLKDGYNPKRTLIISLGYDEEAIGRYGGAVALSQYLVELYGEKKFYAVLDEGGGVAQFEDVKVASVGVSEKGYLDIYVDLETPGGHSSVPPDHTGIGIISALVVDLEQDPFSSVLTEDNPLLDTLRVVGELSSKLDEETKEKYIRAKYDASVRYKLSNDLAKAGPIKYLQRTSQAVDVINSGVKVNALPEKTSLGINHRISIELTAQGLIDRIIHHAVNIGYEFDVSVVLQNGTTLIQGDNGLLNISWVQPLDPSPISTTLDSTWDLFAGSVKHTFQNVVSISEDLAVAPMIVGGYTDARRYWPLTDHIYRFIGQFGGGQNIHAINENFLFDSHVQTVVFLYDYILNVELYS